MTSGFSTQLAGIVLCGGAGKRMGVRKADLPWNGGTLLARALACLDTCCRPLIVSAAPDQLLPDIPQSFVRVDDSTVGAGPLGAIASALRQAQTMQSARAVLLAVDMPFVTPMILRRLIDLADPATQAVIPIKNGVRQPLVAVYHTYLHERAADLLNNGERSVQRLLDRIGTQALPETAFEDLDPQGWAFEGCNTPEEYERLRLRVPTDLP